MVKPRKVETVEGIQGVQIVTLFDQMQRRFRDKGWLETEKIIQSGISSGRILEIGPGPGYLGLEWLKKTHGTTLQGLDISPDMIAVARRNASEYGLSDRACYVESSAERIPFEDSCFDGVFSNGSLHEWEGPIKTLNEMWRVLKPAGKIFISDLRRDMNAMIKWFMWAATRPKEIRPGLLSSIAAAYIPCELQRMMQESLFENFEMKSNPMGIVIVAEKSIHSDSK